MSDELREFRAYIDDDRYLCVQPPCPNATWYIRLNDDHILEYWEVVEVHPGDEDTVHSSHDSFWDALHAAKELT